MAFFLLFSGSAYSTIPNEIVVWLSFPKSSIGNPGVGKEIAMISIFIPIQKEYALPINSLTQNRNQLQSKESRSAIPDNPRTALFALISKGSHISFLYFCMKFII